jgi:hypothetical protein
LWSFGLGAEGSHGRTTSCTKTAEDSANGAEGDWVESVDIGD